MSLFIVGTITGAALLAGLFVVLSEQIRAALRQRPVALPERLHADHAGPGSGLHRKRDVAHPTNATLGATEVSAESRAAAYYEILDALGDDLDQDIAKWEAVLEDFPQVIGAEEPRDESRTSHKPVAETSQQTESAAKLPTEDQFTAPLRTRRIEAEELGMILRLFNTGFACEEIALWLNLPLERVHEVLPRK